MEGLLSLGMTVSVLFFQTCLLLIRWAEECIFIKLLIGENNLYEHKRVNLYGDDDNKADYSVHCKGVINRSQKGRK